MSVERFKFKLIWKYVEIEGRGSSKRGDKNILIKQFESIE